MQSGYTVSIDGIKASYFNLADVFKALDARYAELEDPYAGILTWVIEDYSNGFDAYPVRFAHESMEGGFWDAYAEDAKAFASWLEAFGWSTI